MITIECTTCAVKGNMITIDSREEVHIMNCSNHTFIFSFSR